MTFKELDIVVYENKIVQCLDISKDKVAVVLQDIHTKEYVTIYALVSRKANNDECRWFCEHTEHINFKNPKHEKVI